MRKFLVIALLISAALYEPLNAQYYYYNDRYYDNAVVMELGISGGAMNALTDLGGKKGIGKNFIKDLRWATARPSYGVYAAAMYKNAIGVRLEATFGEVTGYDSIIKNVAPTTFGRYERNLSFRSKINEIQLALEVHPLFFKNYVDEDPPRISPYAVIGVGRYNFDPEAKLDGQWYALHPLSLEGQGFKEYKDRKPYDLTQFNVLGGLGLKYEINSFLNARLEFIHRVLFTDYLDDVSTNYIDPTLFTNYLPSNLASVAQRLYSRRYELVPNDVPVTGEQRGDPKDNDAFFTIQLKLGITLGRQRR
ncbi:MAG TPA: hypothetical protein VFV31_06700 [Chitinophagaceae bacterium]|nr:hypothetical protein [Chitinophagaceae bacterium]